MALLEPTEEFLWKGLLLPGLHPVTFLCDERLGDGGVEGGQALRGGEETLPRPHEGAIKRPWGRRRKGRRRRNDITESTEVSHGTNRDIITSTCILESFKQAQMQPFNKNQVVILNSLT